MDVDTQILEGEVIDLTDETAVGSTGGARGFANPEVLARAQETRRRNSGQREAVDLGTERPDGTTGARRGRPKTSRNLKGIEQLLLATHLMIATATGCHELMLDEKEGTMLAEALANLSDQYKIKLDGKSGALIGLLYAVGAIYGPRAVTIGIRIRSERKADGNPVS